MWRRTPACGATRRAARGAGASWRARSTHEAACKSSRAARSRCGCIATIGGCASRAGGTACWATAHLLPASTCVAPPWTLRASALPSLLLCPHACARAHLTLLSGLLLRPGVHPHPPPTAPHRTASPRAVPSANSVGAAGGCAWSGGGRRALHARLPAARCQLVQGWGAHIHTDRRARGVRWLGSRRRQRGASLRLGC